MISIEVEVFIRTRISQTRNRCDDVNGKYGLNEREKERHTQTKIQKERKKERQRPNELSTVHNF